MASLDDLNLLEKRWARPRSDPGLLKSSKGALPLRYLVSSWRNHQLQHNSWVRILAVEDQAYPASVEILAGMGSWLS